jgi:cell wall-associated NlpC family hydrolase
MGLGQEFQKPGDSDWLEKLATRMMGIPFRDFGRDQHGMDCFGFAIDFYRRSDLGIELKDPLDFISREKIKAGGQPIIDQYKKDWRPLPSREIQPGDLLLIAVDGKIIDHMGIVLASNKFVHCIRGQGVIRSRISDWRSRIRRYLKYDPNRNS